MKPVFAALLLLLFVLPAEAQRMGRGQIHIEANIYAEEEDHFVHPFLAHMGLPEMPNEVSLRLTAMRTRTDATTDSDFGVHVEAGLFNRVGLHIRSDGIRREEFSEVMLQFALLADKEMHNGIALFGQLSVPTGQVEENTYKGLFGASFRLRVPEIVQIDGNIHYDPREEMAEHETAFVFRANHRFYPVFEIRGHITEDDSELYILPAIKFRIAEHQEFGIGFQAAVTDVREYDTQALLTYGMAFE